MVLLCSRLPGNVHFTKSEMHVRTYCIANLNLLLLADDVLVAVTVVV